MSDLSRKATKVNTLLPYLYTEHILVNIFHQTVLLSGKDKVMAFKKSYLVLFTLSYF
jgi:hypothetical protein